ncbi:MAG: hypothetical protein HOP11_15625 [Saprospiraceae bacterium]|nr:hypothetical protein [Saprospiraceae bacterium]
MKNYYELIEDYLNGELELEDRVEFELELERDPDLKKQLHLYKELYYRLEASSMRRKVNESIKTGLQAGGKSIAVNSKLKNFGFLAKIAATTILAISLIWFLIDKVNKDEIPVMVSDPSEKTDSISRQEIVQTKIDSSNKGPILTSRGEKQNNSENLRSKELAYVDLMNRNRVRPDYSSMRSDAKITGDSLLVTAASYYVNGKYQEVIRILGNISSDDESMIYLRAHSYFMLGEFNKAIYDFEALQNSFQYKYDAQWNKLLCFLGNRNFNQFNSEISKIIEDKDHPFYDKAKKLNEEIHSNNKVE